MNEIEELLLIITRLRLRNRNPSKYNIFKKHPEILSFLLDKYPLITKLI